MPTPTSLAWRNRRAPLYQTICHRDEITSWQLLALLDKYGKAFDDEYTYRFAKNTQIVIRQPLWMNWQYESGRWTEKFKRRQEARQTKLLL